MPRHRRCYICHWNQHETQKSGPTFKEVLDLIEKENEKNETKVIVAEAGYCPENRSVLGCKTIGNFQENFMTWFLENVTKLKTLK